MNSFRLVIVEDSEADAELLLIALKDAGIEPQWQRVEKEADYTAALETNPDLVLCDYGLPRFNTGRALELLRKRSADIPFIIVSGHIGDDVAVDMLKAGANDYLLKDNLARLAPAMERELREADTRRRARRLEEALRAVADAVSGMTGKAFLESLVLQLAKATEADSVFVGEFTGENRTTVQTVAVCANDRITENFSYPLEEIPTLGQIFSGDRSTRPVFSLVAPLDPHSYMGTLLTSSAGTTLGLIVIMHSARIAHAQVAESLLRVYAVRAAVELERMAQTALLEFQATHDPLTQLFNRHALLMRMTAMMKERNGGGALLLIDLDRFKEINDTLGHQSGDEILQQIGPRLLRLLDKNSQMLCRLGGDEFAVLVTEQATPDNAEELATKLLDAIYGSFEVAGIDLQISASIGIALYPDHGNDAHELLRQADVAMYLAKKDASYYRYRVYDPALDLHSRDRLVLMHDLRRAIENDELVLHYQPKVELQKSNGISLEALVRWQHPERGLLPPVHFVPLAEMTELIGALTMWVMDAASIQCKRWRDAGYPVSVAVNISTRNLLDGGLPDEVAQIVRVRRIEPSWLEFEITESSIMADPKRSLEVLERIAGMGHQLSIDDFGTGYSSLAYLAELPVQNLKIDREFVSKMIQSSRDASIVQSTIGLAHNLGMRVIAEGVEDRDTLEALRHLQCDQAQGYYISKPKPVKEIETWMNTQGEDSL